MLLVSTASFIIRNRKRNYKLIQTSSFSWEQVEETLWRIVRSSSLYSVLSWAHIKVKIRIQAIYTASRPWDDGGSRRAHVALLQRKMLRSCSAWPSFPQQASRPWKCDIMRCLQNILTQKRLFCWPRKPYVIITLLHQDALKTECSGNKHLDSNPITVKKLLTCSNVAYPILEKELRVKFSQILLWKTLNYFWPVTFWCLSFQTSVENT